jgi:hypothetical protein
MIKTTKIEAILFIILLNVNVGILSAQPPKTTPKSMFGHNFGDDYWLANYKQLIRYWQQMTKESDRIRLERIGTSTEGRVMWMAIISSRENLKHLNYYKLVSSKLAIGKDLTIAQAHSLAARGRAIVWIDGGLHANHWVPNNLEDLLKNLSQRMMMRLGVSARM